MNRALAVTGRARTNGLFFFYGYVALLILGIFLALLVSIDDALHQRMTDYILLLVLNDAYALDTSKYPQCLQETGLHRTRQVDLGGITRYDHLAVGAKARKEHLHLVTGGVLRLVEDDDGII